MNRSDRERQLEARVERERSARRQAEIIAERGMRELWDVNRQLRDRIEARTEQVERVFDGAERAVAAWADELAAAADRIEAGLDEGADVDTMRAAVRHLGRVVDLGRRSTEARRGSASPSVVADELLARWQHRAARRGQLLTVHAARTEVATADWVGLFAVAEVLIGAAVLYGGPGAVEVDIHVATLSFDLILRVPPGPSPSEDDDGTESIDVAVDVAERIVGRAGGTVTADYGETWEIVANFRAT